ncbi:flagellar basal body P-ring formation chaperone FlgA [Shinella zoogloeoides]|jgi:flagella basal body P-ring formation protein FlgA|uniref:flagellar basal body P-ring formation chaperone FlgA n=1 Tax=Shinella zoogloeoides TaxID=352475 RepID=UPI00273D291F|nr:flagellar basal body P-ring formation chaperone FlgA [Shinella zoogloeoides]WLR93126.1 flagellar basal body P-ring formation chaperone FlgA [Shinella zoogloeoides]
MMFRLIAALRTGKVLSALRRLALAAPAVLVGLLLADAALADARTAVVPKRIIYPGEEIDAGFLEEVEVTNPNIVKGYAENIAAVSGMISKRTLLPGRVILVSALREPFAVSRGTTVQLVFDGGSLVLRAAGTPLQDAAVGDLIKVRNKDSGVIVSGTVMADGTVHVVAK